MACLGPSAGADVTHTVARGHTLEAIAHRYHVTVKAIVDANHLKDPNHLKPGMTLTIPGVQPGPGEKGKSTKGASGSGASTDPTKAYAMRAKTPGVIHAMRLLTNEAFTIRVSDRRGRQTPTALKQFEKMLRAANGSTHPIDPRLIALAAIVSNHFGSRKLEYISGFRPYSPTQYTPHSNHNLGRAMDFRVEGVPNEALRDYCRTLKNVGVGYYPNSTFVHLDVRTTPAYWIDFSKPGEPPRYNSPNVEADEGTSDVGNEMKAIPADGETSMPPPQDSSAPPAMSGESPAAPAPSSLPTQIPPPAPANGVPPTLQTGMPPTQIAPPAAP
ncbi:MAG: DUF882 domain-containing protein [Polyangiaceae bacterium]